MPDLRPLPGVSVHARERARERLGRDLSDGEWLAAVLDLVEGRLSFLCRDQRGVEQYAWPAAWPPLARIIWHPAAARIVTVVPVEWGASADLRVCTAAPLKQERRT